MDFSDALRALKDGKRVARAGWNGKGMFITIQHGNMPADVPVEAAYGGVPINLFEPGAHGTVVRMPNLNMRAADGATVTGWLASQTDMLAEDWTIVE